MTRTAKSNIELEVGWAGPVLRVGMRNPWGNLDGYITAYKAKPRDIKKCQDDISALTSLYGNPPVWVVDSVWVEEPMRGSGWGRLLYDKLIETIKAKDQAFYLSAHKCTQGGSTSSEASRVWSALARKYPASGLVIGVGVSRVTMPLTPRLIQRHAPPAQRVARRYRTASLVLYHGGQRWDGSPTIKPHRKGHAEHGPGIYLTTAWETANKYAKGPGAVYRVTLSQPRGWAEKTRLPVDEVLAFVKDTLGRGKKARAVTEAVERVSARTGDTIPAFSLISMFVNNDLSSGSKGPLLAAFLVEQGVDASLVHQGNEDWVVVFNPSIIKNVEKLAPADVDAEGFPFDLPRLASDNPFTTMPEEMKEAFNSFAASLALWMGNPTLGNMQAAHRTWKGSKVLRAWLKRYVNLSSYNLYYGRRLTRDWQVHPSKDLPAIGAPFSRRGHAVQQWSTQKDTARWFAGMGATAPPSASWDGGAVIQASGSGAQIVVDVDRFNALCGKHYADCSNLIVRSDVKAMFDGDTSIAEGEILTTSKVKGTVIEAEWFGAEGRVARVAKRYLAAAPAGFHGQGMSPSSMRLPGPQFSDKKPIPPDDIEEAIEYLEEIRPGVLVAYSRGGAIAMLALKQTGGAKPKVIYVAPAWQRGWANISSPPPGVILHGDADNSVPLQDSCELAQATGSPLRIVPDRNHITILKDKTNPGAGILVPKNRINECIKTLPDWGSGKGSPDDVARQQEFTRSLSARVAARWLTAGILQAPPKLVEAITKWAQEVFAARSHMRAVTWHTESKDKVAEYEAHAENMPRWLSPEQHQESLGIWTDRAAQTKLWLDIVKKWKRAPGVDRWKKPEATFDFTEYLDGWKYKHLWDALSANEQRALRKGPLRPFTVIHEFRAAGSTHASWAEKDRVLELWMYPEAVHTRDLPPLVKRYEIVPRAIRHELQHVTQNAIGAMTGSGTGGLPKRKLRRQETLDEQIRLRNEDRGSTDDPYFTMDIEYQTALEDAVLLWNTKVLPGVEGWLRRAQTNDRTQRKVLKHYVRTYVDDPLPEPPALETGEYTNPGWNPPTPVRSPFFRDLKRDDKAKWKNAVGTFYKEIAKTTKLGADRVAARFLQASYQDGHTPSEGPPAHDLTALVDGDEFVDESVYEHPEWYTAFRSQLREFWPQLLRARGKPNAKITIYRALPSQHNEFNRGDWIALSRDYATTHAAGNLSNNEAGHVISASVPAKHIKWAGDDLAEWGYWGSTVKGQ